jgi:hypothetical protein
LSRKGHLNHDARVGGHDANSTNTVSSILEFALSSLTTTFDE